MSQTALKLLQAAAEILGGEEALALRLDIGEILLRAYIAEQRPVPSSGSGRQIDRAGSARLT